MAADPTLTELGILEKYHDELLAAGITGLSQLEQFGDLTAIKGIGPVGAEEIRTNVTAFKQTRK